MKILTSKYRSKYLFDGRVENKFGQLLKEKAHAETWAVTLNEAKRNIHHQLTAQLKLGRGYPLVFNEDDITIIDDEWLSTLKQNDIVEIDDEGYEYKGYNIVYNNITEYYDIFKENKLIMNHFINEAECEEFIDNLVY